MNCRIKSGHSVAYLLFINPVIPGIQNISANPFQRDPAISKILGIAAPVIRESPANARSPSLASTGPGLGLVWEDARDPENGELWFGLLTGDGQPDEEPFRLTEAPGATQGPRLLHANGRFGLTFFDSRAAPEDRERSGVYFAAGPFSCP